MNQIPVSQIQNITPRCPTNKPRQIANSQNQENPGGPSASLEFMQYVLEGFLRKFKHIMLRGARLSDVLRQKKFSHDKNLLLTKILCPKIFLMTKTFSHDKKFAYDRKNSCLAET